MIAANTCSVNAVALFMDFSNKNKNSERILVPAGYSDPIFATPGLSEQATRAFAQTADISARAVNAALQTTEASKNQLN